MASPLLAHRILSLEHPKSWLKGQALLSVFISLCILITFVPEPSNVTSSISGPISISTISHDYAMLPIPSRAGESLSRAKTNKNDTCIRSVSAQDVIAFVRRYECFIPSLLPFSNRVGNFHNVFRRDFRQACLLLDVPPPSDMVSSEIRGCSILLQNCPAIIANS
jgi:hypothetical protein